MYRIYPVNFSSQKKETNFTLYMSGQECKVQGMNILVTNNNETNER